MSWQICLTDQYGSTSINSTVDELEEAVKNAKGLVSEENVSNALTSDEKKRNWEYAYVDVFDGDETSPDVFYCGKNSKGEHCVFNASDPAEQVPIENMNGGTLRFYLGFLDQEDWYADDLRGNLIDTFDHQFINDKSFYFVKKQ